MPGHKLKCNQFHPCYYMTMATVHAIFHIDFYSIKALCICCKNIHLTRALVVI